MKYVTVIGVFLFVCGVCSVGFAQNNSSVEKKISLHLNAVSIVDALDEIQRVSGVDITYNLQQLNATQKVNIHVTNEPLQAALAQALADTKLVYKQVGTNIVITRKDPPKGNGVIMGVVSDHQTGELLPGCNITLGQTTKGTQSDTNGNFRLEAVPEGIHTLHFSYVGYKTAMVPDIQVKAGTVTRINYALVSDNSLQEVVVTAAVQLENSTEISVINEIKSSNNIVTGISTEQINRSMDRDAAEVVRRATGVTIVQDRFVVIRGLEPRYTLTMINGLPSPSTESDRRSFSFDMLNSSTIDRVMVYKTPAPELPADFAGGVVKVYTKNSANSRQLQVQLSTQYRPGSSFSDYYTYQGGKTDWLGIDDGTRKMPANLPLPQNFPDPVAPGVNIARPANANNARLARSFPSNWNLMSAHNTLDKRAVVNYYTSWKMGKSYVNSLSSLTYTFTTELNQIARRFGFPYYDAQGVPTLKENNQPLELWNTASSDQTSTESARITAMQNFKWVINDRNAIEFRNFFNQLGRDQVIVRDFRDGTSTPGDYIKTLNRSISYNFSSRSLYVGGLSGEHTFQKPWLTSVSWRMGYGYTSDQQPDFRNFTMNRTESLPGFGETNDPEGAYRFSLTPFRFSQSQMRGYNALKENTYTTAVDLEKKFTSGAAIKLGMFTDYRARTYDTRAFAYRNSTENPNTPTLTQLTPNLPSIANSLFDKDRFLNSGTGMLIEDISGFHPSKLSYRYDANNRQHAGYAALYLPLFHKHLTIYAGVRAEWNRFAFPGDFRILAEKSIDTIAINETKLYILPSVNVAYHFTPKMQLRAAYGMTLNRPEFRELAPIQYLDQYRNMDFIGNYNLTNAEVQNIDLRWEFYPTTDEMISIGGYYKSFTNAIEQYSFAASNFARDLLSFVNTDKAKGYGVELEVRKRLSFIPIPLFQHMAINANLTLLHTEIDLSEQLAQAGGKNDLRRSTRPLQGSSPYSLNINLYYDNTYTGTQVSALYNVIGQRLTTVGNSFTTELYEMPRNVVDFTITQRISPTVRIRAGVQDILNQPFRMYRDNDRSQTYNPSSLSLYDASLGTYVKDYMADEYRPGSYYSLGLLFAF